MLPIWPWPSLWAKLVNMLRSTATSFCGLWHSSWYGNERCCFCFPPVCCYQWLLSRLKTRPGSMSCFWPLCPSAAVPLTRPVVTHFAFKFNCCLCEHLLCHYYKYHHQIVSVFHWGHCPPWSAGHSDVFSLFLLSTSLSLWLIFPFSAYLWHSHLIAICSRLRSRVLTILRNHKVMMSRFGC